MAASNTDLLAGLAKRTLILTPKSVQIQWQNELYEKFNLNVPIYDGASLCWKAVHGMQQPVETIWKQNHCLGAEIGVPHGNQAGASSNVSSSGRGKFSRKFRPSKTTPLLY